MTEDDRPTTVVRELLTSQLLGVLGTHSETGPYSSLVAFAATEDLHHLLFVTGRSTRKWANLTEDARASMLVDSRSNRPQDFADAAAVTALGVVEEVTDDEREEFTRVFLGRHPYLTEFSRSPSCVMLRLRVHRYMLVTRFQHVVELSIQ
jgi:nitroimidazol reductase NimA-like FMN-containing flavoprotein (pyridoxamine 5'-phosphate oxidase superfamily)